MVGTGRFCNQALGMQSGRIKNKAVKASSIVNVKHAAYLARLHRTQRAGLASAWCPSNNNHLQWLQIDLVKTTKVTGIATQGRIDKNQWVKSYWIKYSQNEANWAIVRNWGSNQVRQTYLIINRDAVLNKYFNYIVLVDSVM